MSMEKEHLQKVLNKPAVVCCRTEAGTVIDAVNLEDPDIFPDLVDSGLLKIPSDCLTVSQAIGGTLTKTLDSLTPITPDAIKGGGAAASSPSTETASAKTQATAGVSSGDNSYAVTKFNLATGTVIQLTDLESSSYLNQLVDSRLIDLANVLKVNDCVGKTLVCDVPALTGLTPAHFGEVAQTDGYAYEGGAILKIQISEGKGINIEIPLGSMAKGGSPMPVSGGSIAASSGVAGSVSAPVSTEPKLIRTLKRRHFKIEKVELGKETKIDGTTLYIRKGIEDDCKKADKLVVDVKLDIITKDKYSEYSDTIMDVQPIATKEGDSKLGSGITRILDGVVMVVTGVDEGGVQVGEFGSSEGKLEENIMWGRPGAPDHGDILVKTRIVIKAHTNMERPGPLAAHHATEVITQEIREALKKAADSLVVSEEEFKQYRRPGKNKVVVVKEIMGQGAMHDNLILPVEPVGVLGAKPNVDLGNLPIVFSPLDLLDGGVHALTCIGPASKECSRHYFREPLVMEALKDEEIDFCGVILVGSPQINSEKFYVSERLGMTIEMLDAQGAIVGTEGFGNNHVDFASHIEQIGMRGLKVVGISYSAVQGALVVGNKYMTAMIDNNKSEQGIENEILSCNTLCPEDAVRALAMLKADMAGETIAEAERKWNPNVKENNVEAITKAGIKVERSNRI